MNEVSARACFGQADDWMVAQMVFSCGECIARIRTARANKEAVSIGLRGNVVDLWEALAELAEETGEMIVDLGSDQTSLHNPYMGGYYPAELSFEEGRTMMTHDPEQFKRHVTSSLQRHATAINKLTARGNYHPVSCASVNAYVLRNEVLGLRQLVPLRGGQSRSRHMEGRREPRCGLPVRVAA